MASPDAALGDHAHLLGLLLRMRWAEALLAAAEAEEIVIRYANVEAQMAAAEAAP